MTLTDERPVLNSAKYHHSNNISHTLGNTQFFWKSILAYINSMTFYHPFRVHYNPNRAFWENFTFTTWIWSQAVSKKGLIPSLLIQQQYHHLTPGVGITLSLVQPPGIIFGKFWLTTWKINRSTDTWYPVIDKMWENDHFRIFSDHCIGKASSR